MNAPFGDKVLTISFLASSSAEAREAREALVKRYGNSLPEEADVIVALGGDGLMLQTLHRCMSDPKPIYGMNRGSVGFLMNDYSERDLRERLAAARPSIVHPLDNAHGRRAGASARFRGRSTRSRCCARLRRPPKLKISVDGAVRLAELYADGVLVATPAGSTAYNLSVNGPILPLDAPLMAMTPMAAFRPRRWRGALLPDTAAVSIEVLEPAKRPVAATADHYEIRDVASVDVETDHKTSLVLLHDPGHSLDERILREQFRY